VHTAYDYHRRHTEQIIKQGRYEKIVTLNYILRISTCQQFSLSFMYTLRRQSRSLVYNLRLHVTRPERPDVNIILTAMKCVGVRNINASFGGSQLQTAPETFVGRPQIHLIFHAPLSDSVQMKRFVTSRVQTSSPLISHPNNTAALYLYDASS
jgi:hypothetical protein